MSEELSILQRLDRIEDRLDHLEGKAGYRCVGCKTRQPLNNYWYSAHNAETKEEVKPLCHLCIRGEASDRFSVRPWKHQGPFRQPVS